MARIKATISLEGEEGSDEFSLVLSFDPELPQKGTDPHMVQALALIAWQHIKELSGTTKITSKDIIE